MSEMANPKLSVDEQSALDAQFDTRAAVPEHPMMFARWAERSAQARLDLGTLMDLKYGPHPRQRIDLVDAGMHSPLLVFLHGGFWRAFDKSAFTFIAPPFVDHGISVAVVDYALCPEVTVREVCDQVATAVAYLREVAPNHSFDAERTVLAGHSVGAHMAVWLGGVDWTTRGLTSQPYHGVVAISGIYDLVPVSRSFLNADLKLSEEEAWALSPLHEPPGWMPPAVFAVGDQETEAFREQQDAMVGVWQACGAGAEVVPMAGFNHFDILDALADPASRLFRAACRLAEEVGSLAQ